MSAAHLNASTVIIHQNDPKCPNVHCSIQEQSGANKDRAPQFFLPLACLGWFPLLTSLALKSNILPGVSWSLCTVR